MTRENASQAADYQRMAFNSLAEEFEAKIVRDIVKEEGTIDRKKLKTLKSKKDEVVQQIRDYVSEMMIFSIEYAVKMYEEGNLEWDCIPKREHYAHSNAPGGEMAKAIMLLALGKAAEKGYEVVAEKKEAAASSLLEYFFVRLGALLEDEVTIKYDSFPFVQHMFDSHLIPIFTEFGRFGIEVKHIGEIGSWYLEKYQQEYADLFNELLYDRFDPDIPPDLFVLLNRTLSLGAVEKEKE